MLSNEDYLILMIITLLSLLIIARIIMMLVIIAAKFLFLSPPIILPFFPYFSFLDSLFLSPFHPLFVIAFPSAHHQNTSSSFSLSLFFLSFPCFHLHLSLKTSKSFVLSFASLLLISLYYPLNSFHLFPSFTFILSLHL